MDSLKLVIPTLKDEKPAKDFKQEFFDCGETVINGSALLDKMEYDEWLIHMQNNSCHETVSADWVISTTYFVVRESDDKIIGMIDIRHNIDNQFLAQYGGHIGYSVRPSERCKGYATEMLRQALDYARSIELSKVMLGCYLDNVASKKTIIKCGGELAEIKPYLDGKMMEIYWIQLSIHGGRK